MENANRKQNIICDTCDLCVCSHRALLPQQMIRSFHHDAWFTCGVKHNAHALSST